MDECKEGFFVSSPCNAQGEKECKKCRSCKAGEDGADLYESMPCDNRAREGGDRQCSKVQEAPVPLVSDPLPPPFLAFSGVTDRKGTAQVDSFVTEDKKLQLIFRHGDLEATYEDFYIVYTLKVPPCVFLKSRGGMGEGARRERQKE